MKHTSCGQAGMAGVLLCLLAQAAAPPAMESAVRAVLNQQVAAWNQGNVKEFMQGYAASPETTFVGRTVTHGHEQVLQRYLRTYPNREAMGTLTFSDISVRALGPEHALVLGQFHLQRQAAGGGDTQGLFTLVFGKTPAGWRILHDHTSSAP